MEPHDYGLIEVSALVFLSGRRWQPVRSAHGWRWAALSKFPNYTSG